MYNKLQYISQGSTAEDQFENIRLALEAGCRWIQLRFKNCSKEINSDDSKNLFDLAKRVKEICTSYNATFILNDHAELAQKVDADGVHLGLNDMPIREARKILKKNKIIGGSANTWEDVLMRTNEECDYIGLGPFRFTSTKEKLSPILGINGYELIVNEVLKNKIDIPIYAIGGIGLEDVASLMKTGIYGVAVSGAITNHSDKKIITQKFNSLLHEKTDHSR